MISSARLLDERTHTLNLPPLIFVHMQKNPTPLEAIHPLFRERSACTALKPLYLSLI